MRGLNRVDHSENSIGMGSLQVIADYQLERWLQTLSRDGSRGHSEQVDWQQLTQYAAFHAINAWYSLPAGSRTFLALTNIFERKWTNKIGKFSSTAFYHEVKHRVLAHLHEALMRDGGREWPLLLFESMDVWLEELNTGLSLITQVMVPSEESFEIHKYVVEDSEASLELFTHMTVVFCNKAFGVSPDALQVVNLMNGKRHHIDTKKLAIEPSLDYLRLVKEMYLESRTCTCCIEEGHHGTKSNVGVN
jgi:hypothetical protein